MIRVWILFVNHPMMDGLLLILHTTPHYTVRISHISTVLHASHIIQT